MIRDRKGQAFVPGFLDAAASTPLETAGELPGGGEMFKRAEAPERAAERAQDQCRFVFGGWINNPARPKSGG